MKDGSSDFCNTAVSVSQRMQNFRNLNSASRPNTNQQAFKLDFEYIKTEILQLDAQVSQEIDCMLKKLEELDIFKQKRGTLEDALSMSKEQLHALCSEQIWGKIRTSMELAETLHQHTRGERDGWQANTDSYREKLDGLLQALKSVQMQKKAAAEKYSNLKRELTSDVRRIISEKAQRSQDKNEPMQKARNLIADVKIAIEEQKSELKVTLQRTVTDYNLAQNCLAQLTEERDAIFQETQNIQDEIEEKLWRQKDCLPELSRKQRKKRDGQKTVIDDLAYKLSRNSDCTISALKEGVDRAFYKLTTVEELLESVKAVYKTAVRAERNLSEDLSSAKAASCNLEEKLHANDEEMEQKYNLQEKMATRGVAGDGKDLEEVMEELKSQQNILDKLSEEKLSIDQNTDQVYKDKKEAINMIARVKHRVGLEKDKIGDVQQRNQNVLQWKRRVTDAGIMPHCLKDRLRNSVHDMGCQLRKVDNQNCRISRIN